MLPGRCRGGSGAPPPSARERPRPAGASTQNNSRPSITAPLMTAAESEISTPAVAAAAGGDADDAPARSNHGALEQWHRLQLVEVSFAGALVSFAE